MDGVVRRAAGKFIYLGEGEICGPAHSQLSDDERCSNSEMICTCTAGRYDDLAAGALRERCGAV